MTKGGALAKLQSRPAPRGVAGVGGVTHRTFTEKPARFHKFSGGSANPAGNAWCVLRSHRLGRRNDHGGQCMDPHTPAGGPLPPE